MSLPHFTLLLTLHHKLLRTKPQVFTNKHQSKWCDSKLSSVTSSASSPLARCPQEELSAGATTHTKNTGLWPKMATKVPSKIDKPNTAICGTTTKNRVAPKSNDHCLASRISGLLRRRTTDWPCSHSQAVSAQKLRFDVAERGAGFHTTIQSLAGSTADVMSASTIASSRWMVASLVRYTSSSASMMCPSRLVLILQASGCEGPSLVSQRCSLSTYRTSQSYLHGILGKERADGWRTVKDETDGQNATFTTSRKAIDG